MKTKSHNNRTIFFVAILGAAAILGYATNAVLAVPTVTGNNTFVSRWEHAALTHDSAIVSQDSDLSAQIVRMGNEGWELVSVTNVMKEGTTSQTVFYFKRPK